MNSYLNSVISILNKSQTIITSTSNYIKSKDHLGDVVATYTDLKLASFLIGQDPRQPWSLDLLSVSNYYPFGMLQPGRHWEATSYFHRFGYNGKEKDDDIKGLGNSYDYGARFYDPRIGRWLTRDPLEKKYPNLSPYHYAMNNPVMFVDPDGKVIGLSANMKPNDRKWIESALSKVTGLYLYLDLIVVGENYKLSLPHEDSYRCADNTIYQPKFTIEVDEYLDGRKENIQNRVESNITNNFTTYHLSRGKSENGNYYLDYETSFTKDQGNAFISNIKNNIKDYIKDISNPTEQEIVKIENELIDKYGEHPVVITGGVIHIDDVPNFPAGFILGHELGGIVEELQNPTRSWLYTKGIFGDQNGGHSPANNPHKIGAEKGEELFKTNNQ